MSLLHLTVPKKNELCHSKISSGVCENSLYFLTYRSKKGREELTEVTSKWPEPEQFEQNKIALNYSPK